MLRILLVALGLALAMGAPVSAASLPDRGLSVTPARQFITARAGRTVSRTITIANDSPRQLDVSLSVKKFNVSDLSYDFRFEATSDDRVSFNVPQVNLQPRQSRTVSYTIDLPADSPPGGSYYALFATTQNSQAGAVQKFEAVSLLYLTTSGDLTYDSGLPASSIDHLVFGGSVPFSLDITNSGNSHYFAYLTASLRRPFMKPVVTAETHLLLPQTTRHFETTVPAPLLPGLYHVTYGYSTDHQMAVSRVSRVIYLPPWSIVAFVILVWLTVLFSRRRRAKDSSPPQYK